MERLEAVASINGRLPWLSVEPVMPKTRPWVGNAVAVCGASAGFLPI